MSQGAARGTASIPVGVPPTIQKFTSGSGTYTTPSGVLFICVRMVGGGGGGGGGGNFNTSGIGGTGGNTTFGSSLLVANSGTGGGVSGGAGAGGSGGTASLGTGPIGTVLTGGSGQGILASTIPSGQYCGGGQGAGSVLGGCGGGGVVAAAGLAGATNTGAGGGGGASNTGTYSGAGGGSGGFVDVIIVNPSSSYSYAVGAAGTAGTAGTSGFAGGAGGSGYIEVTEFYLPSSAVGQVLSILGGNGAINFSGNGLTINVSGNAKIGFSPPPGGRLTLTTGVPVTTTDVTGATNIYYTPYLNNYISLWNGTEWTWVTFTETTLALGTITSGLPYDVFGYLSSGSLALEKLAWTNGTTRATGISIQDGRYCKTGDETRLYLGTFYTTATTTTEDSVLKRFLWNMYNRVRRQMTAIDTTDNWSYTTGTWRQARASAVNQLAYIAGLDIDIVEADVRSSVLLTSNSARVALVGVGVDSTTASSSINQPAFCGTAVSLIMAASAIYCGHPGVGYHYLAWLEKGADGTCSFYGDNGADGTQTGISGTVWS